MASGYVSPTGSVPKIGPDFARAIASRQATEYIYAGGLYGEDEHPSRVVREHSEPGDRIGEVYDRMLETDANLAGLWEKRAKAVTGLPWSVLPGDETADAQTISDACTEMLYGIRSFETNLSHQLEAVAKGVAFDELRWEQRTRGRLAGLWTIAELTDRPMYRFGFKNGVLCVRQKGGPLVPVPPGRMLHLAHGTKDTPWGAGLLDRVWWFYWLTLHAWKYYGVAIEKWAQPTVIVRYPRSSQQFADGGSTGAIANQEMVDKALAAARDFQTEYAVALPDDIVLELKEATGNGSVTYQAFLQLLDRAKALVFLGEIDTSGLSEGPGSFAKNRVSNEVRYETIQADACELSNGITDGLLAPFVRVNFGLDAPMPYFEFDVEEASDRTLRQAGSMAVFSAGYPQPRAYWYRVHQVPQPKPGEPTVRGPFVAATAPPPAAVAPGKPAAAMAAWADQELAA